MSEPADLDQRGLLLAAALAEEEHEQEQQEATRCSASEQRLLAVLHGVVHAILERTEFRFEVIALSHNGIQNARLTISLEIRTVIDRTLDDVMQLPRTIECFSAEFHLDSDAKLSNGQLARDFNAERPDDGVVLVPTRLHVW